MEKDNLKELMLEFGDNVKFNYDLKEFTINITPPVLLTFIKKLIYKFK